MKKCSELSDLMGERRGDIVIVPCHLIKMSVC